MKKAMAWKLARQRALAKRAQGEKKRETKKLRLVSDQDKASNDDVEERN